MKNRSSHYSAWFWSFTSVSLVVRGTYLFIYRFQNIEYLYFLFLQKLQILISINTNLTKIDPNMAYFKYIFKSILK